MKDYNNAESSPVEGTAPAGNRKFKKSKWILATLATVLLAGLGLACYGYEQFLADNVNSASEEQLVQFPSGSNLEDIANILHQKKILKNKNSFLFAASWMNYKGKAGQYRLPIAVRNNRQLIRILRRQQEPVRVTFNNIRKIEQLGALVCKNLEMDSLELNNLLANDAYIKALGYNRQTLMSLFIPNTYEFYWTTTARDFVRRMQKEHKKFWNEKKFAEETRRARAEALGWSPEQVYTLASIVETETQHHPEKRRIAGVYVNRLKKN